MTSRDVSRRDFLRAASLGVAAAATPKWLGPLVVPPVREPADHCIMLLLGGGPSQLDTWDMKPEAVSEVRSCFRPIRTNVDGIQISEIFPRMAKQADKYVLVRSVHSCTKPLHSLGSQEIQTGRVFTSDFEFPHCGSVVDRLKAASSEVPGHVLLSRSARYNGKGVPAGQSTRSMGDGHAPPAVSELWHRALACASQDSDRPNTAGLAQAFDLRQEPQRLRERYGQHEFGQACLAARRAVEHGVKFVTVDMFDVVAGQNPWDIHGSRPFASINCYRDYVGPMFDRAYSALLEDLQSRGLLQTVLVLAVGEFGRTPRINSHGGRDHWTGCWTAVFAGGGVRGGQVVGTSDAIASEPRDRPVTPAQIVATVYHSLGVALDARIRGLQGAPIGIVETGAEPILELF